MGRGIIRPLTGLRGITVFSVVSMHFSGDFVALLPGWSYLLLFSNRIAFRMDLFFMLSGFITSYVYISLTEECTLKTHLRFLKARLIRLYPSYFAAFLTLACGVAAARLLGLHIDGSYPLSILPARLALLQAWPYFSYLTWTWNYPTWFLSALWFAYLAVFPFAWRLVHRLRGSKAAFFWVFIPIMVWLAVLQIPQLKEFHIVIRVTCEFLAGCALFVLYIDRNRWVTAVQNHLDVIVACFLLLLLLISMNSMRIFAESINLTCVMATPLLLAGMTAEASFAARFLATAPLQWLGKISYALFLSHGVVLKAMGTLLPSDHFAKAPGPVRYLVAASYAITILVSAVALHYCVEAPVAAFFKNRSASLSKAASGDDSAASLSTPQPKQPIPSP